MPTPSQTDTHTHTQSHLHLSLPWKISAEKWLCLPASPTLCLTLSVRLSVLISYLWCVCVWFCWWNVCMCVAELLGESRQDLSPYSEYSKDERRGREGQKGRKTHLRRHGTSSAIHFFLSLLRNIYNMKPQSMTDPQILFLLSSTVSAGEWQPVLASV